MVVKNIRPAISPVCNMNCIYCSSDKKGQIAKMEDFRRTPIDQGCLTTAQWLEIYKCFFDAGFRGISLTGGEPTLNPDWIDMLSYCHNLGYISTELTSNLVGLGKYKEQLLHTVGDITKFKVSLDTFDAEKYKALTRVDALDVVLDNIKFLVKTGYNVQLNRVTMKSTQDELVDYINKAKQLGVSINLLDLVYYAGSNSENDIESWKKEFVSAEETWTFLHRNIPDFGDFASDRRYGHRTSYQGMNIVLKDSTLTKRNDQCETCPLYCQEGIFTVRIGSDGNITMCPDFYGNLPSMDGVAALNNGSLTKYLEGLFLNLSIEEKNHFPEYLRRIGK